MVWILGSLYLEGGDLICQPPPHMKDSGSLVTGADKLYKVYTHVVDTIKRVEMPEWEKLMNTLHPRTSVSPTTEFCSIMGKCKIGQCSIMTAQSVQNLLAPR